MAFTSYPHAPSIGKEMLATVLADLWLAANAASLHAAVQRCSTSHKT